MYNIVICDNDINFISEIKDQLISAGLNQDRTRFIEYHSGNAFLLSLNDISSIDLLFLNIHMPDINSFKLAELFRKQFEDSLLVFCSSEIQPCDNVFDYNVCNYIMKDSNEAKLSKKFKSIVEKLNLSHSTPHILGSYNSTMFSLLPSDIMYITKSKSSRKIKICPEKNPNIINDELKTSFMLDELYELTKEYNFEYAHSSYIVNFQYIANFSHGEIVLSDGTKLNISRSKKEYFLARLKAYFSKL